MGRKSLKRKARCLVALLVVLQIVLMPVATLAGDSVADTPKVEQSSQNDAPKTSDAPKTESITSEAPKTDSPDSNGVTDSEPVSDASKPQGDSDSETGSVLVFEIDFAPEGESVSSCSAESVSEEQPEPAGEQVNKEEVLSFGESAQEDEPAAEEDPAPAAEEPATVEEQAPEDEADTSEAVSSAGNSSEEKQDISVEEPNTAEPLPEDNLSANNSQTGNSYVAELTEGSVVVGTGIEHEFKLTFTEVGSQTLGSARLDFSGSSFTDYVLKGDSGDGVGLVDSQGRDWYAEIFPNYFTLKASDANAYLTQGESVSVVFKATAPGDAGIYQLGTTQAWIDNTGADNGSNKNNPASYYNEDVSVWVAGNEHTVSAGNNIQTSINSASDYDLIKVEIGTYNESLTIPKSIALIGSGMDSTIIQPAAPNHAIEITGNNVDFMLKDIRLEVTGTSRLINFTGRENTTVIVENTKMDYSQEGRGIQAHNSPNTNINLKNSIMDASDAAGKLGSGYAILLMNCEDSSLTITGSTVTAAHYAIYLAGTEYEVNIVNESAVTGYAALSVIAPGSVINVEDSVLKGRTFWSGYFYNPPVEDANSFATVAFQTSNCTMHVKNSIITNEWVGDNTSYQMLFHIGRPGYNFENNKVYIDGLTQLINTNTFYAPLSVGGDAAKGNSWYINGVEQELPPIIYDFYVHPDGDDENDGLRPVTAFKTLAKAEEVAEPGDTIFVYVPPLPPAPPSGGSGGIKIPSFTIPAMPMPPLPAADPVAEPVTPPAVTPEAVVPFIVIVPEPLFTVEFVTEGSLADLAEAWEAYEAARQAFEANRDSITAEQTALHELDQAVALAAILTLELVLETEEADLDAAVEAYLAAMELLEEHGSLLSEEQLETVTAVLEAIAVRLAAFGAEL